MMLSVAPVRVGYIDVDVDESHIALPSRQPTYAGCPSLFPLSRYGSRVACQDVIRQPSAARM